MKEKRGNSVWEFLNDFMEKHISAESSSSREGEDVGCDKKMSFISGMNDSFPNITKNVIAVKIL